MLTVDGLREADAQVLAQLRAHGDPLTAPRDTLLFFHGGQHEPDAARAKFKAIAAGGAVHGLAISVLSGRSLSLRGEHRGDPASLKPLIEWALAAAAEHDVEFDGWECAVVAARA